MTTDDRPTPDPLPDDSAMASHSAIADQALQGCIDWLREDKFGRTMMLKMAIDEDYDSDAIQAMAFFAEVGLDHVYRTMTEQEKADAG